MMLFTLILAGALAAAVLLCWQYAELRHGRDPFRPLENGRRPKEGHDDDNE